MVEQFGIALFGVTAIPKSRAEARLAGAEFYSTGRLCKHGHLGRRRVSNATCVTCEISSAINWQKNNPEKVLDMDRKRYKNDPVKRGKQISNAKLKNPEKYRKMKENDYENNRDRYIAAGKERYKKTMKEDPASIRLAKHKRRAVIAKVGGILSKGIVNKLLALQKGKCACCGLPLGNRFHMDHIMPLALGGENSDQNIQLLRQQCNNKKHAKHPIDYMQQKGFLL